MGSLTYYLRHSLCIKFPKQYYSSSTSYCSLSVAYRFTYVFIPLNRQTDDGLPVFYSQHRFLSGPPRLGQLWAHRHYLHLMEIGGYILGDKAAGS